MLAIWLAGAAAFADCNPAHVHLRWDGGQAEFRVEIADDAGERNRGLMFRRELARFAGMLFVYPAPDSVSFWMKNTLIPLDMLFLDATGTVVKIHPDAIPQDLTAVFGGDSVQYVLEVNGGLTARLGIPVGAQMRHPLIDPTSAAWSCQESG
jgi:uncharacterized membrane protein (UPF0127 family)